MGDSPEHGDAGAGGKRAVEVAVYALAALLAGVAVYKARHFYDDDAFITLRYVRRWIDGSGPTWTDGERVQGYTHPLWFLQLALLGRLGVPLTLAPRLLGVLYLGAIFAVFQRARALPSSVLVLATLPGLSVWAMGGLETVSFAFWIVLGTVLTIRIVDAEEASWSWGALAGATLAAAALTRPEGLGVALVAACWIGASRRWRALPAMGAACVAPVAAWATFSLAYYGDVLPNVAYAKVTGYPVLQSVEDGFSYLAVAASSWAWAVVGSLVVLALIRRAKALWILAMVLPIVAGLLLGGGDHMPGARLMVPAAVLVVFAAGLHGARARPRWALSIPFAVAAALQMPFSLRGERPRDMATVFGGIVGRYLAKNLPPGSLAAGSAAGATAFFAPSIRFIDTLGLNDRHIARRDVPLGVTLWQTIAGHRKGDGDYVLERAPDVVILGSVVGYLGIDPREWFLTDYELLENPEFRMHYAPYSFLLDEGAPEGFPNLHLTAYLRAESAAARAFAATGTPIRGPWRRARFGYDAASAMGVGFQP